MSDQTTSERSSRSYTRRQIVKGALGTGAVLGLSPLAAACGGSSSSGGSSGGAAGGSITIGSFSDPAMVPFRDVFLKKFKAETGITANYHETNYNAWYQNSKTDGLQKTGAYDIYVMDDNWVPEYAAGGIVQSLDKLGLKVNPDILPKGLEQGYWPPKSGPRLKAFANGTPELFSLVIIDDVEILYDNKDYFPTPPVTWDDIYTVAKTKSHPPSLYG
ncbi:MAG: extracellular solute-binding protein, partial [Acidimicrobiales bacterium]